MENHWIFVINPASGKGAGLKLWLKVEELLRQYEISYEFEISQYPKHTTSIVSHFYSQGYRKFIGLGGDGTINEIVNGIFHPQQFSLNEPATISLIPIGTGNDWVRNHHELNLKNLIHRLQRNQSFAHDIGLVKTNQNDSHYFINVAGAGLDGAVAKEISELAKTQKKNKLSYLTGTIKALLRFKAPSTEIKVDSQIPIKTTVLLTAASIGKYFGNGMLISPKAHFSNGSLNVTVVKDDSNWIIFPQIYKLFNGKIGDASFVQKLTGKSVEIVSQSPIPVQADGENLGMHTHINMSVLKHAIRILS